MTWHVGDGHSCLFWEDHWLLGHSIAKITPAVFAMVPKRRQKRRTIVEGIHGRSWVQDMNDSLSVEATVQYIELWTSLQFPQLSDEPDQLSWKMTAKDPTLLPPATRRCF